MEDIPIIKGAGGKQIAKGKTLAEVERALPEPEASPMFMSFTQPVNAELTKGYPVSSPPWSNVVRK